MSGAENASVETELNQRLHTSGFRFTSQRRHVYDVILAKRDHPTAEEVFLRAKPGMADISMATVYNCLDALLKCGLVRQVNLDRAAARFCPNMREHGHFHCDECGGVTDVGLAEAAPQARLPEGFVARRHDVAVHGLCPGCAAEQAR